MATMPKHRVPASILLASLLLAGCRTPEQAFAERITKDYVAATDEALQSIEAGLGLEQRGRQREALAPYSRAIACTQRFMSQSGRICAQPEFVAATGGIVCVQIAARQLRARTNLALGNFDALVPDLCGVVDGHLLLAATELHLRETRPDSELTGRVAELRRSVDAVAGVAHLLLGILGRDSADSTAASKHLAAADELLPAAHPARELLASGRGLQDGSGVRLGEELLAEPAIVARR